MNQEKAQANETPIAQTVGQTPSGDSATSSAARPEVIVLCEGSDDITSTRPLPSCTGIGSCFRI